MQKPKGHYRYLPTGEEAGTRLDQFLAAHVPGLSRTLARKVIDIGGVHVGGRRIRRCGLPVRAGEAVEIHLDGLPLEPWRLADDLVLFRDRWLIAVDKPAGIDTQPTPARYRGTLYEALLCYLQDPYRPLDPPPLGMAQRLDRDTSGVIAFSLHPRAHKPFTLSIAAGGARKLYLALVAGAPAAPQGELRSFLARSRAGNLVRSVERGGKEAITRYRILEAFGLAALLEIELLTGRSHQIRAHFAEAGHPLLGDARYGGPSFLGDMPLQRQLLHSHRLQLPHPVTGESLAIESPLPADMEEVLHVLRGR